MVRLHDRRGGRELRLGIVGLGWVARDYMLPAVAEHPRVRLGAVCSRGTRDFDGLDADVPRYRDLDAFLAREADRLDAVYVATPNHLHAAQTRACLDAGLAVLCEKPLAADLADARAMARAVRASGLPYATAFDQRHHPAHLRIAELVARGTLGTLTLVRLDYACWLPADWSPTPGHEPPLRPDNWRIDRARAGGGAVIDLAPHGLDLVEVLTGTRVARLQGLEQRVAQDYAVDDGGAFVGQLATGALLVHTVGYNRPESLPRRRLELIGTAGSLLAEDTMGQTPGGRVTYTTAATGVPVAVAFDEVTGPFLGQLDALVRQVLDGAAPARTIADDLRLATLLDAATQPWASSAVATPAYAKTD